MSVHKNPVPKNIIRTARNNALSRCRSADESIIYCFKTSLSRFIDLSVRLLNYCSLYTPKLYSLYSSILERIKKHCNPDYQLYFKTGLFKNYVLAYFHNIRVFYRDLKQLILKQTFIKKFRFII